MSVAFARNSVNSNMEMRPNLGRISDISCLPIRNSVKYGAITASHSDLVEIVFAK